MRPDAEPGKIGGDIGPSANDETRALSFCPLAELSTEGDRAFAVGRLGALCADTLARAIARGVYEARAWPGSDTPAWRDLPAR